MFLAISDNGAEGPVEKTWLKPTQFDLAFYVLNKKRFNWSYVLLNDLVRFASLPRNRVAILHFCKA